MAEVGKNKENLFKKIYRKIRRRGQPYPPPYARNRKRDEEQEEDAREEAEQQQEIQHAQKEIQHAVRAESGPIQSKTPDEVRALRQQRNGAGENQVRLAQVDLPDLSAAIPAIETAAPGAAAIVKLYEQERINRVHQQSSARLTEFYNQILENTPEAQKSAVDGLVLSHLRNSIVELEQHEHRQALAEQAERQRAGERQEQRYDYLHGVQSEAGNEARLDDVVADRRVRDLAFDKIFALVDAQPDQQFQTAFDIFTDGVKYRTFLDDLLRASQNETLITPEAIEKYKTLHALPGGTPNGEIVRNIQAELKEDLERYKLERRVREVVHNANFALDVPNIKAEQVYGFVDGFSSELIDYVWRIPGVRDMMNIYENQLRKAMWDRDGYLDPEDVRRYVRTNISELPGGQASRRNEVRIPEIEKETKRLFQEYVSKQGIYVRSDDRDKKIWEEPRTELKDHEVDRVFTTARGMMVLSMRMLSLASESKMPPKGQFNSLFLQDVMQSYAPFVHLLAKYNVPSYKALSMLLTEPDRDKTLFGKVRKPWQAKQLAHVAHVLQETGEGTRKILDGRFGELLQIRRLNPALCGDAFGFLGWRAGEDAADVTGTELFLRIGEERMRNRVAANHPANEDEYIKEYGNWIGTGFRFERLRGDLLSPKEDTKTKAEEASKRLLGRMVDLQPGRVFFKSYKVQSRLNPALDALAAELGYGRSTPVDAAVPEDKPGRASSIMMQRVSDNLLFLESKMHQMRETLLDDGFTFHGTDGTTAISLDEVLDRVGEANLPHADPNDMEATQRFRELMNQDFAEYQDNKGHWEEMPDHGHGKSKEYTSEEEGYHQEFIYNREYNHAFTLWSGDAPVDEFNMAATGPTGGFARRARENQSVGEANQLLTGMLSDLKYIRTPDEAFGHLTKIYSKIADYDAEKAKETVTYLSEGLLKLFGATGLAKIPILGGAIKTWPQAFQGITRGLGKIPVVGKPFGWASEYMTGSAAQMIFDNPRMPVWHATEMRYFIQNLLYEKGYISKPQMKDLANHMTARKLDVNIDLWQTMAPLLSVAILIWLLKESSEDV